MAEEDPDSQQKSWLERLAQAFSGKPGTRAELIDLLRSTEQRALIDAEALSIIEGALAVTDMQAREIMIPRPQMIMVDINMTLADLLPRVIKSGHSRFPVIGDKADDVVGILLAKDLLPLAIAARQHRFNLRDLLRPCKSIPESKRLNVLLQEFKEARNHIAVVFDEYGAVSGMVTIEDVLEQIVGEIEDEFDIDEEDHIKQHSNTDYTVKALTSVDEFNETFGSKFSDEEFDTMGGIVTHQFGHLPKRDEAIDIDGFKFKVLNADNRRIRLLQLTLATK